MDCNNTFNGLNESLLASALQFYFPQKKEPKPKTSSLLDVDLFELKRAYNVPVDLDIRVEENVSFINNDVHQSEEEEEFEEHLPIEFCESLIDEEEESVNDQTTDESNEKVDVAVENQNHVYNCIHCVFKGTISDLRNHREQLHKDCTKSVFWCVECKVDFENEAILKLHQVQEHVFYCSKCFHSFKTQKELVAHMALHNRSKSSYQCTICNKIFPIRRYFMRHLERHEKKKKEPEKESKRIDIFQCTQCQKQFMKKESLVKHTKIHSRDSLKCSLCDFTCVKKVTLKMHLISHEGNRKYKCDHCDFSFKQVGHLKRHIARFNH